MCLAALKPFFSVFMMIRLVVPFLDSFGIHLRHAFFLSLRHNFGHCSNVFKVLLQRMTGAGPRNILFSSCLIQCLQHWLIGGCQCTQTLRKRTGQCNTTKRGFTPSYSIASHSVLEYVLCPAHLTNKHVRVHNVSECDMACIDHSHFVK